MNINKVNKHLRLYNSQANPYLLRMDLQDEAEVQEHPIQPLSQYILNMNKWILIKL